MHVVSDSERGTAEHNSEKQSAGGEWLNFKLPATILQFDYGFILYISVSLSYEALKT